MSDSRAACYPGLSHAANTMSIRRSKLICTLGPASDSVEKLKSLIDAGMDVARFNFSHGSHEEHAARLNKLRAASDEKRKPIAVLQDLCGPKIRTGKFASPFDLKTGAELLLTDGNDSDMGSEVMIPISYEGLAVDVRVGDRIMFDDGRIVLAVKSIEGDKVRVVVTQGGSMRSRVGVHLPTRTLRIGALTEKDKSDLAFGLSIGIDYVALSFVRRADDIRLVREICQEWGKPTPVVAKIETPEAVENIESVVAASDAVMVARGDLGVEFPPERVPVIQHQILAVARRVRRPVIIATEMLQSMTKNSRPTRAEASDVAHSVLAGADCVMLSGETANGDYPTEATAMMSAIAVEAESSPFFESAPYATRAMNVPEAVARGAVNTAREIGAKFLVAFTETGMSARNVSLARPSVPVVAFSPNPQTRRRMALLWGVIPREVPANNNSDTLVDWVTGDLMASGLASPGERVVIVFGAPIGVAGSTNTIRVHVVG
ncbi:MAG: pyruvate kinase [Polyangiaceae bacterium]|nr:pyruvate kinase [Polyangiaceae bacterium]